MSTRLFAATAIGIALATAAYAQSPTTMPSKDSAKPTAAQSNAPADNSTTTSQAPAREHSNVKYTERDRDVVRKHANSYSQRRLEGRTTGSTARTEIRVGERVPETVEIEAFPDEVHRDAPALREYRFIRRYNSTYMVDPRERMIIEEID